MQFCFNKNAKKALRELDTINLIKIIDKIKTAGIKRIRFIGGEPLLRMTYSSFSNMLNQKDFMCF